MEPRLQSKGPWTHRVLIAVFTILLGLLLYWLLGFVVRDIGTWPGPTRGEVEREMISAELLSAETQLRQDTTETTQAISDLRQQQSVLRDSTDNSRQTMNQLLELQRLSLQKGVTPTTEEQQALAESETLFLQSQRQYQRINEEIAALTGTLRQLEKRQRENTRLLREARIPSSREYETRLSRHRLKLAALKLTVLIPLLAAAGYLFIRHRSSLYAPAIYALGLATSAKVLLVMHEHFPKKYFKYLLIIVALLVVARVLIYLLRMVAFPRRDWLLKQYREAYERFLCPICAYPIRRGPMRFMYWNRRTAKKLCRAPTGETEKETPYTCPACGSRLYEECSACHGMRHSLLPVCAGCGSRAEIGPVEPAPVGASDQSP